MTAADPQVAAASTGGRKGDAQVDCMPFCFCSQQTLSIARSWLILDIQQSCMRTTESTSGWS